MARYEAIEDPAGPTAEQFFPDLFEELTTLARVMHEAPFNDKSDPYAVQGEMVSRVEAQGYTHVGSGDSRAVFKTPEYAPGGTIVKLPRYRGLFDSSEPTGRHQNYAEYIVWDTFVTEYPEYRPYFNPVIAAETSDGWWVLMPEIEPVDDSISTGINRASGIRPPTDSGVGPLDQTNRYTHTEYVFYDYGSGIQLAKKDWGHPLDAECPR